MRFHSVVAGFMDQIIPEGTIKYMAVRPIDGMRKIFEKSKVPFISTYGQGGFYAPLDFGKKAKYNISFPHWFRQNPYISSDAEEPIVTMKVDDLKNYIISLRS